MVRVTSSISRLRALVALTCLFSAGALSAQGDECDPDSPVQMNDAICGPGLFSGKKGGWGYSGEIGKPDFGRRGGSSEQPDAGDRAQQQALQEQSEALKRQSEAIDRKLKQLEDQQRELEELKEEVRDSLKQKSQ